MHISSFNSSCQAFSPNILNLFWHLKKTTTYCDQPFVNNSHLIVDACNSVSNTNCCLPFAACIRVSIVLTAVSFVSTLVVDTCIPSLTLLKSASSAFQILTVGVFLVDVGLCSDLDSAVSCAFRSVSASVFYPV